MVCFHVWFIKWLMIRVFLHYVCDVCFFNMGDIVHPRPCNRAVDRKVQKQLGYLLVIVTTKTRTNGGYYEVLFRMVTSYFLKQLYTIANVFNASYRFGIGFGRYCITPTCKAFTTT